MFGLAGILFVLIGGGIPAFYSLAVVLPSLAVQVRRLHDINRSAWGLLLLLGTILLFIFSLCPGDPMPNLYGPVPPSDL